MKHIKLSSGGKIFSPGVPARVGSGAFLSEVQGSVKQRCSRA